MSYYKDPRELFERTLARKSAEKKDTSCTCGTGIDYSCTAHENNENAKLKNRFPWGTAILIILLFVLLIYGALYGGFNPLLFPGACE